MCRLLILALSLTPLAVAAQTAKKQPDKDYKDELPRIPPTEPADALKTFRLRSGFRLELVASEPLLTSPVAIDFDENGRMFVVEYPEYNQYANPKFKGHGRIRMLESTKGDGRYDKSTIYVDNLDSPTAVSCFHGGIFVGAVPDILYCKDTKKDGKADVRVKVFTGFGRDKAGEAMFNSFRWGLDNRMHVCTSLAGGSVRRADEPNAKPVNVKGQGILIDPRTKTFELTSGGGQHGMSMDDWGRKFVCANSDPMHMIMYDGRYVARNPYLAAPAAAINILPSGRTTKLFRISPVEPWRALRTKLRKDKIVPGSDEGGDPAGFFTSATGITVYRGDAWPEEYRGNIFVGEVASNMVFRARTEPSGVGLTAKRADEGVEFIASSDIWFRPVQFANGPDGNLYIVDMYRELIEGAAFLPPAILKHMDVGAGLERGRIYRVVPENFKQPKPPRLGSATTADLVALLEHPNGWHRDTASRLLYERQDSAAVGPLKKLAAASKSPLGRLHALYALEGLKALEAAAVVRALADPESGVREHALRLAERFAGVADIRASMEKMVEDADMRVRYQLAFSLGNVAGELATRSLVTLAKKDGQDSWFRLALLSSAKDRGGDLFRLMIADKEYRTTAAGRMLLGSLATQIGAAGRKEDVAVIVKALEDLPEPKLGKEIVAQLVSKAALSVRPLLSGVKAGKTGTILADMLREAKLTAGDEKQAEKDRAAAIRTLGLAAFADVKAAMADFLKIRQPAPVQAAALETLSRFDQPEVASLVLAAWPGLSPKLRTTAAETLFARPAWIEAFLDAVEKDKVGRGDVDPARLQLLQSHPDKKLRARAEKLLAATKLPRREKVVAEFQKALTLKGDVVRGKSIFKKDCSACHRLEGVGNDVGADLTAIRNRGSEAILLNILDPNREVLPQFLSYYVVLDSGKTVTGMITAETATSITVRRPDQTSETILRLNIEELRSTGQSFMPEGLEKQISIEAMADLLAYLNSIR